MKKLVLWGALALAPILVQAQYSNYPGVLPFAGVPSGSCALAQLAVNTSNGNLYTCSSATWTAVSANPFASGGTTINVIPKSNGAGLLVDGSITDSGATVATALPLNLTQAASTTNAIVEFNGVATTGLMFGASTQVGLKVSAAAWLAVDSNQNNTAAIPSSGLFCWSSSTTYGGAVCDTGLRRVAAASVGQGLANNGTPAAQTFTLGESSRGGTDSNIAGAPGTTGPGIGTGNAAGTKYAIRRNLMGATGSTAQSTTDGFVIGESKTLSNTSATATSLVNISVPSNSSAGVQGVINVSCNDGTNFDSETNTFFVSVVNKAGAMTVGTAQLGTPSTANNSGSCTTAITAVAGTNSVDIKVTPVIGTIVPTTVTGTVLSLSSYATGNVTIN